AVLLAAGAPGKRSALPHSRIVIHQPYTEGGYGQASDIEIQANEILRMRRMLEEMIAENTGRPIEQVARDIERDKYLSAEQAVEYGLIDEVLTTRKKSRIGVGGGRRRVGPRSARSGVGRSRHDGCVPGRVVELDRARREGSTVCLCTLEARAAPRLTRPGS